MIRPGQLNLMTAGNGVAHAEEWHADRGRYHGIQLWVAQPDATRHGDPAFDFANILCNPSPAVALRPGRLERTVAVIAEETGVDERQMLEWVLAWCGLSAAWSERSGGDASTAVGVGRRSRAVLGR